MQNKPSGVTWKTEEKMAIMNAAGLEDLRAVISHEKLMNEELRYNYGKVLADLSKVKKALVTVVLSSAKVDDRLVGNIIDRPSRTKFLNESIFTLHPVREQQTINSKCKDNKILARGWWTEMLGNSIYQNFGTVFEIPMFKTEELWLA